MSIYEFKKESTLICRVPEKIVLKKQKEQSRIPNNSNKTTKEQTVEIKQHLSKKV